jgi:hypothetical protein
MMLSLLVAKGKGLNVARGKNTDILTLQVNIVGRSINHIYTGHPFRHDRTQVFGYGGTHSDVA